MKIHVAALLGVTVFAVGCAPPNAHRWSGRTPLKPVSRLDCPERKDELVRTAAADGKSCTYTADGGATEVQLRLVPVADTPDQALQPIEAELKTLLPAVDATAASRPPSKPAEPGEAKNQDLDIDLPGLSIHTKDDKANIRIGGMRIKGEGDGDRNGGSVKMTGMPYPGGRLSVDANDGVAIVRTSTAGPNVRSSLTIASDTPSPAGWRAVGYEAAGPRAGPLVVAVIKTRTAERNDEFGDIKGLVWQIAGG